jgi:hypothetical protein
MRALTPQLRIEPTGTMTSKATNDPGAATYSLTIAMMPLGEHETIVKATGSSYRIG